MNIRKSRRVVITTKYLGPTNTKGARVKATAADRPGSVTVSYHGCEPLPHEDPHDVAAREYCEKMGWESSYLYRGDTETGAVYLFAD